MNSPDLTSLNIGQQGTVMDIAEDCSLRRRLQDLGFTPGAHISCLLKSPAGDPVAFLVRGAAIALRRGDCTAVRLHSQEN